VRPRRHRQLPPARHVLATAGVRSWHRRLARHSRRGRAGSADRAMTPPARPSAALAARNRASPDRARYNIPPDTKTLPENASKAGLPQGARLGLTDFKKTGYGGPCPPIGQHRYFHKLYALDSTLDLRGATKSQIERAMQGHVLAMQSSSARIKRVTSSHGARGITCVVFG
jgi:hypothetical protein